MRFVWGLIVTLAAALPACGEEGAPPPQSPAGVSRAPLGPPNDAMLAGLRADDPAGLTAAATAIARSGDAATRRAASPRLVMAAQAVTSQDALAQVVAAMEGIGGPEVVAYCLALGENEAAPAELRRSALAVLLRWADRNDPAVRLRSGTIWERVSKLPPSPTGALPGAPGGVGIVPVQAPTGNASFGAPVIRGGAIANAPTVIVGVATSARRCYLQAVQQGSAAPGAIEVTATIDPRGAVTSVQQTHTGLTPTLVACIVGHVQSASFAPPEGGGATLVWPMRFDTR